MRWESQLAGAPHAQGALSLGPGVVERTFDTPEFRGMTFYEVRARSVLNRVPDASPVPFRWTVNPYRGCSHACVYCFARQTHSYLDLGAGADFDERIVVKVNAGEVLRRELAAPTWQGEPVALGTNVDPYQRAEGRYGVTRSVLEALVDAGSPFSILTKGTLVRRDLDVLRRGAALAQVGVAVSVGSVDEALWREVEPGTPAPLRRLGALTECVDAGLTGGVLVAPLLPGLSDGADAMDATLAAVAASGASWVAPTVLRLPPGAREWWWEWLRLRHPELVSLYRRLYGDGGTAPRSYVDVVLARFAAAAQRHGLPSRGSGYSAHPAVRASPDRGSTATGDCSAATAHDGQLRLC